MAGAGSKTAAKRKPRGKPFQKGQSGNPAGRRAEIGPIKELARVHAPEAIDVLAMALRDDSARVRVAAAEVILDRAYGKPSQHHELDLGDELVQRLDAARMKLIGSGTA